VLAYLIRNATAADLPEMIRLERQCPTSAHWTTLQYDAIVEPQSKRIALITQEDDTDEIAGFLVASCWAPEWELENIVVAEKCRGRGIGTELMQALLTQAKHANSQSIFLEVRDSNAAAKRLYEKLGFRVSGRRKSYYGSPLEDALLYSKDIRASGFTA
jgi:[ribosomal protein S18]-alanine N-acetyltransferase